MHADTIFNEFSVLRTMRIIPKCWTKERTVGQKKEASGGPAVETLQRINSEFSLAQSHNHKAKIYIKHIRFLKRGREETIKEYNKNIRI